MGKISFISKHISITSMHAKFTRLHSHAILQAVAVKIELMSDNKYAACKRDKYHACNIFLKLISLFAFLKISKIFDK